jgi:hypothetical protein
LLDEKGKNVSYEIFKDKFSIQTDFLTDMGIVQAVTADAKRYNFIQKEIVEKQFVPLNIELFVFTKYDALNKSDAIPTGKRKWIPTCTGNRKWSKYIMTSDSQWKATFQLPFSTNQTPISMV